MYSNASSMCVLCNFWNRYAHDEKQRADTLFKANGTCEITTPSYVLIKSLTSMQFAEETHSTFSSSLSAREFSLETPKRNHNSFHTRQAWNKMRAQKLGARQQKWKFSARIIKCCLDVCR
jgi:hypothetical protein